MSKLTTRNSGWLAATIAARLSAVASKHSVSPVNSAQWQAASEMWSIVASRLPPPQQFELFYHHASKDYVKPTQLNFDDYLAGSDEATQSLRETYLAMTSDRHWDVGPIQSLRRELALTRDMTKKGLAWWTRIRPRPQHD